MRSAARSSETTCCYVAGLPACLRRNLDSGCIRVDGALGRIGHGYDAKRVAVLLDLIIVQFISLGRNLRHNSHYLAEIERKERLHAARVVRWGRK